MREKESMVASPVVNSTTPHNMYEGIRTKTSQAMRAEQDKRYDEREHMREIKEKQDKIKMFGRDNQLHPSHDMQSNTF